MLLWLQWDLSTGLVWRIRWHPVTRSPVRMRGRCRSPWRCCHPWGARLLLYSVLLLLLLLRGVRLLLYSVLLQRLGATHAGGLLLHQPFHLRQLLLVRLRL